MKIFQSLKPIFEKKFGETTIQVFQRGNRKELRFGNNVIQSAISEEEPDSLVLAYTRAMAAGFLFFPDASDILQIGLGGGSIARFIHRYFPMAQQQVVESCPGVIKVAYRYFSLPVSPRLRVCSADGGEYMQGLREKFDLIFLDAYHADGVSDHLKTVSFYQSLRDCLTPDGWLVTNVWGSDKKILKSASNNLSEVFSQMFSLTAGLDTNMIFIVGNSGSPPTKEVVFERAVELSNSTPLDFLRLAKKVAPTMRSAGGNSRHASGVRPSTSML